MADTPAPSHDETGKKVTDADREREYEGGSNSFCLFCLHHGEDLAFYFIHRELTLL
jgi:hypothetical protein